MTKVSIINGVSIKYSMEVNYKKSNPCNSPYLTSGKILSVSIKNKFQISIQKLKMTNNIKKSCKHGKKSLNQVSKKKHNSESTQKKLILNSTSISKQKASSMNNFKNMKNKKCSESKESMKEVKFVNLTVIFSTI